MDNVLHELILITAVCCGVVGGVLFAFSAFVMKALARLPAEQGIAAMQSINITVLSPLCSVLFFGTGIACVTLMIASFNRWSDPGASYLLAGSIAYIVGLLITGAFNVPLNNKLAVVKPASSEGATLWRKFVPHWMMWNHIRTIACIAASTFFILAYSLIPNS